MITKQPDIVDKIIISEEQICDFTQRVANEILSAYSKSESVVVLSVLNGASAFTSGLKNVDCFDESKYQFLDIRARSYGHETTSSGNVTLDLCGHENRINGRDILVIDDIYDTGRTLSKIKEALCELNANSIAFCVMLERECEHSCPVTIDFKGTTLSSNAFVIGYGLDYKDQYRDLPYIATVKKQYQNS